MARIFSSVIYLNINIIVLYIFFIYLNINTFKYRGRTVENKGKLILVV
jgi:hypothetical protein